MTPTTTETAAPSPAPVIEVPKAGTPEYANWRMTGKVPEPKAAPAPAKETPAKGETPEAKTAPAPEAGKDKQERHRSDADTRLNELLDDLREAGLTPKALRSFRQDYQRTQAETARADPEKTVNPAVDPKAPVKPKPEDFEGKPWAEYEAAKDKYFEDLADYKASRAIETDRERQKQEATTRELHAKVADAEKRYGTEARQTIQQTANTIFTDAQVPPAVKAMVNDSPVMVDLLYVMGSKPADLEDFMSSARSNGSAAIRKLVLVEQLVIAQLAKQSTPKTEETERGSDGKFKAKPPETKTTAAPPPPREVAGTGSVPPDESAAAVKRGDFRAFQLAENRKAINRRRGT